MEIIAHIHTDFPSKFGIPRQSGLVEELTGQIVFTAPYRNPDAVRGLDGFSHIWILWQFSRALRAGWAATVRPPRLGGNTHMGVFATRSPFRPNPIGLSCVRLERVELDPVFGPILHVQGADLMDGTPIYDIKPYLPYADSYPQARTGFVQGMEEAYLKVVFPDQLLQKIPQEKQAALQHVLAQDPRPTYQNQPDRRYGMAFAGFDVRFTVQDDTLTVCEVVKECKASE